MVMKLMCLGVRLGSEVSDGLGLYMLRCGL